MEGTLSIIITSVLSSTTVCVIVGWLARSWISERLKGAIKSEYDLKLESFKDKLKASSDVQIEQLKASLQIATSERSVQFSHLYAKTAETIAEVYSRIVALRDAVADYTSVVEYSNGPSKEERRMVVGEKYQDLQDFYNPKRIYLPRELDDQIAEFVNGLYNISLDFRRGVEEGGDYRPNAPEDQDTWMKAHDYIRKDSKELLKSLEEAFQTELGISRDLSGEKKTEDGD